MPISEADVIQHIRATQVPSSAMNRQKAFQGTFQFIAILTMRVGEKEYQARRKQCNVTCWLCRLARISVTVLNLLKVGGESVHTLHPGCPRVS
jgi:hypothetical protein